MRNFTLCLVFIALLSSTLHAQYVYIPDGNLMEALLNHGVDTNEDLFISFEEAEAVDSLSLFNKIVDMTGIEAFTNLRYLDLCNLSMETPLNLITSLDVSSNTSLEFLDCSYNLLDTLILGNQENLLELNCFANTLITHLDLSGCPNLVTLICGGNPLEEVDISSCTNLEAVYFDEIFDPFTVYVWMLPFPPEGLEFYGLEAEVQYIDIVAPVVTLLSDQVYLPGTIEFSSSENGVAYLVSVDTLDAVDEIRLHCLDSLEVTAGVTLSFDMTDYYGPELWIQAADGSLNLSEPSGFAVAGVGVENDPELAVTIYPNPAREMITISGTWSTAYSVEIADINGRIIFSTNHDAASLSIDLKEFRKGLYFLRISNGTKTLTRKFIKQ